MSSKKDDAKKGEGQEPLTGTAPDDQDDDPSLENMGISVAEEEEIAEAEEKLAAGGIGGGNGGDDIPSDDLSEEGRARASR